jgi:hypothetical protein
MINMCKACSTLSGRCKHLFVNYASSFWNLDAQPVPAHVLFLGVGFRLDCRGSGSSLAAAVICGNATCTGGTAQP